LTMGDGGTISVATSGAGNAGNIALNVTNFTQTGGARVDSSTAGGGLGGDITLRRRTRPRSRADRLRQAPGPEAISIFKCRRFRS
jgi:hypothetical protein